MVDFQERDTSRGFRFDEDDEGDEEDEEPPPAGADATDDGEPDIDEVRAQLEESPGENGETPRDGDQPADDPLTPRGDGDPTDGTGGDDAAPVADDGGLAEDDEHDATDHRGGDRHETHAHGEDDDHHDHHQGDDHHHAHDVDQLGVAAVTISSSRTLADDPSGDAIVESMVDAGHDVVTRELIPDDHDDVQRAVDTLTGRDDVDVVVTTGGTGVTPDDTTVEAVRPLLDKELPGFGELFRRLSYDDIGTKVVGTRATAGIAAGAPVFCLPGSTAAVELAVDEIITAEAPHLAGLARRDEPAPTDAE